MFRSFLMLGIILLSGCGSEAREAAPALELTGRVVDQADVIDSKLEDQLTARLARLERETGAQMVIVTTQSLKGQAIEDYSLRMANAWGVGSKQGHNGLMLLVAPNERKVRIEVGRGLETVMTDKICRQIIQQAIVPHFLKNDMAAGIEAGTDGIMATMKRSPTNRIAA